MNLFGRVFYAEPPGGFAAPDLGSDSLLSQRKPDGTSAWNLLRWSPPECNATLSARHNWFSQPGDTLRGTPELEEIYYGSVGRNCNFLLNVPPNRQGVFDQSEVTRGCRPAIVKSWRKRSPAANEAGSAKTSSNRPTRTLSE